MGNYMYCFPLAARHSFEALHCISEKLKNFCWMRLVRNCCTFSRFLCGYCSDGCLLDCYTVYSYDAEFVMFRKNILPLPSGWQHVRDLFLSDWPQYLNRSSHLNIIQSPWRLRTRTLPKRRNIYPTLCKSPGDCRFKHKYFRLPREDAATSLTYLLSGRTQIDTVLLH